MIYVGPNISKIGGISIFLSRKLKSSDDSKLIAFEKKNPFMVFKTIGLVLFELLKGNNIEWHRSRVRFDFFYVFCFFKNFKFVFHHGKFDSMLHFKIIKNICTVSKSLKKKLFFVSPEMAGMFHLYNCYSLDIFPIIESSEAQRRVGIIWSGMCLDIYDPLVAIQGYLKAKKDPQFNSSQLGELCLYFYGDCKDSLLKEVTSICRKEPLIKLFHNVAEKDFNIALYHSYIYLRTSRVDSYCIALHDALQLNINVVASNISNRPDKCNLFQVNNSDDLANELLNIKRK